MCLSDLFEKLLSTKANDSYQRVSQNAYWFCLFIITNVCILVYITYSVFYLNVYFWVFAITNVGCNGSNLAASIAARMFAIQLLMQRKQVSNQFIREIQ